MLLEDFIEKLPGQQKYEWIVPYDLIWRSTTAEVHSTRLETGPASGVA
jgi:hypothetical protein